jgi:hypothetical protein
MLIVDSPLSSLKKAVYLANGFSEFATSEVHIVAYKYLIFGRNCTVVYDTAV